MLSHHEKSRKISHLISITDFFKYLCNNSGNSGLPPLFIILQQSFENNNIMNARNIFAAMALTLVPFASAASDFISSDTPEHLFNLGVRMGVNSSNRTFSKNFFDRWNVNSWGSGVDLGVVLNLNMREFFSIQPGFFFESRTGYYTYCQEYISTNSQTEKFLELGHQRTYNFVVPVMLSFRFNMASNLKWIVEAGPYAQFKLHASDSDDIEVIEQNSVTHEISKGVAKSNFTDLGVKLGTGIMLNNRYSFSIHYMAGCSNVWKAPYAGGKNKAWTFTLGYDFK